jgi:hypothetical protein
MELKTHLKTNTMIRIKLETDLKNNNGFALYFDGHRTHIVHFTSISGLRAYWHDFRNDIVKGPKEISKLIFGN